MLISIPGALREIMLRRHGAAGGAWLDTLPAVTEEICRTWNLEVSEPPMYGSSSLVLPVCRGAERLVLKIAWPHWKSRTEARALAVWDGRATVRLVKHEPEREVLLLERLDDRRSLHVLPASEAATLGGVLIRRLALPDPGGLPSVSDLAAWWSTELPALWEQLGRPGNAAHVRAAATEAAELAGSPQRLMVNQDMHYANVLAGSRETWLVIDPKALVGDPEFAVCPLLWNRLAETGGPRGLRKRLARIVEAGQLDTELAWAWSRIRAVEYWLWLLKRGEFAEAAAVSVLVEWTAESRRESAGLARPDSGARSRE